MATETPLRRTPHRRTARRARRGVAVLVALAGVLAAIPVGARADACTPPVASAVACENTKPGLAQSEWQVGAGDATIQGFATRMSVDHGQSISFKVKSATADYHVDVLRLGYYGGNGARMVATNLTPSSTGAQPACAIQSGTGLIDCGGWSVSLSWAVPASAVSGVYLARLVRNDTGGASIIPFVVRDDGANAKVLLQTSDSTWAAYNDYGGNNLYSCTVSCPPGNPGAYKGASKVSYNKPFTTAGIEGPVLFYSEYPMLRWMEANGYDMSYIAEVDVHRDASLLLGHDVFVSSGHDEYWSATQRDHVEAARDAGVDLAFFGGNDVFWKTRWEPSIDGPVTADRTLVSYKDTHYDAPVDPVSWTGTWRDPRFATVAEPVRPENALMGQRFLVNGGTSTIRVPDRYKALRPWRNTAVASLPAGGSAALATGSLGYEWDLDFDDEFRPPGTFQLSSTTVDAIDVFTDYGTTSAPLRETHNLTMYRAPSGARVFSAGTVNWSRGLSNVSNPQTPTNRTQRQVTVNVLADMGAQPATREADLAAASPSTDTARPSSAITSPTGGTLADGSIATVAGTGVDAGGGVVAGVEVSTDAGATWHRAAGTASWSFSWRVHGSPSTRVRSRAVDDSGNLEVPATGVTVGVSCPCSIFGSAAPAAPDAGDANAVELGVKFTSDTFGTISGVRFYKSAANTGTHLGSLWSANGTRLAQATFTAETASGWQTATFATPVAVQPGTTYVASYFAPRGRYAATLDAMYAPPAPTPVSTSLDSPPLHAVTNVGTRSNGVFSYGLASSFPSSSFRATNYWVDVLFAPAAAPGQVTGVSATAGPGSARVTWTAPASGGPATSYTVTPYVGATAQTAVTVSGSPPATARTVSGLTAGTSYTFRVSASNANGDGATSAASNAVTPTALAAPGAPTGVTASVASATSVDVAWTAPVDDGGTLITGWTVTPYAGATAGTPSAVAASARTTTVGGLTTGTSYSFRVTATNAQGTGPAGVSASVVPRPAQATIFGSTTPAVADAADGGAVELGVKFTTSTAGAATGVAFYKSAANGGTHRGSLWSAGGTRLAQVTFSGESASGWQTASFATPVTLTPGTTYVVSYHAPGGHYSYTSGALAAAVTRGPLTALATTTSPNGVYAYGAAGTFPTGSYNATNYFVDVLFEAGSAGSAPGPATDVTATAGSNAATVSWTAPASGGAPDSYVVTPESGGVARPGVTVSGSPPATSTTVTGLTAGTSYTFTVTAANANGTAAASAPSAPVVPSGTNPPGAPTAVTARADARSALVSWTAPADGGSPITAYVVTPTSGQTAGTPITVSGSARSRLVTGLTAGVATTFTVKAVNAAGTSPASAPTAAVVPLSSLLDFALPDRADAGDGSSVNLGVAFVPDTDGSAVGVRFYKAAANTGTHAGRLWSAAGAQLAAVTFADESASGWQAAFFSTPVPLTAGGHYVVSYHAPDGHYSATGGAFASPLVHAPLTAPAGTNGRYAYGLTSAFPTSSYNATNYFVDVLFAAGS